MLRRKSRLTIAVVQIMLALMGQEVHAADELAVDVVKTPDAGVQPVAATDAEGRVHLVYFRGDPAGGDLFYTTREPRSDRFTTPIQVNSEPNSAVAMGTIRGGQVAIGRDGRVHVAWNGSGGATPKNAAGSTPMLYARSDADRGAFEPQRNLMKRTSALDGGGSIAADKKGNIYVTWHGRAEDAPDGETGRQLYVARSKDDGESFADETRALNHSTGACACCGTKSLADRDGNVYVLFRAAATTSQRDLTLATSRDEGKSFTSANLHPWKLDACPMSSESMAESAEFVVLAWRRPGRCISPRSTVSPGGSTPRNPRPVKGQESIPPWPSAPREKSFSPGRRTRDGNEEDHSAGSSSIERARPSAQRAASPTGYPHGACPPPHGLARKVRS